MKIQVKTLNQKSLLIEIDESKTVLDLKNELSRYADVGVKPEQQKLIYAGKILEDNDELSTCNIDEKKFLVVMAAKSVAASTSTASKEAESKPTEPPAAAFSKDNSPTQSTTVSSEQTESAAPPAQESDLNPIREEIVANIVAMGYPENEVRNALEASFNNPERAVEYLIEGIPMSPTGPQQQQGGGDNEELELTAFELLRTDPVFRNLRSLIQQNPDLLDEAVQRIGEANPALLSVINENQQEFLSMLFEPSDDEEEGNEST